MNNETSNFINTCLFGQGIVCGLTVHVNDTCDIEIGAGTTITENGQIIEVSKRKFDYYLKTPSDNVKMCFPVSIKENFKEDRLVLELSDQKYDASKMDPLAKQYPTDLPTRKLLEGKILVILLNEYNPKELQFLLVSRAILVDKMDVKLKEEITEISKTASSIANTGIFSKQKVKTIDYRPENIELIQFPFLRLPEVIIPRFGYKLLAIKDNSQKFGTDNFVNPFSKITSFKDIFDEYKAILDDLIPEFVEALEKLHSLYGDHFTHKGKDYWAKYRDILIEKWACFLEEGEHLYYIQYFYDWLCDMIKAYDELCEQLSIFAGHCHCEYEANKDAKDSYILIKLGPVLGGRSSYTPVIFRDYFQAPMTDSKNENHLNEIRFLHWRIMMMIWTFDLPQLKFDKKVLEKGEYIIPAKEFEDSTNYLEKNEINEVSLEEVPIKLTPSQLPDRFIGEQAIPYYYPLDADSPYSIHRYWNYRLTQQKKTNRIKSYNAFEESDSFSQEKNEVFPLAFNLRNYPFLRAEGHIGKLQTTIDYNKFMQNYNLTMNIVVKKISELKSLVIDSTTGNGFEHLGGLQQGHTLVLVSADMAEDIELNECKRDLKPEVLAKTIVADFTIPKKI